MEDPIKHSELSWNTSTHHQTPRSNKNTTINNTTTKYQCYFSNTRSKTPLSYKNTHQNTRTHHQDTPSNGNIFKTALNTKNTHDTPLHHQTLRFATRYHKIPALPLKPRSSLNIIKHKNSYQTQTNTRHFKKHYNYDVKTEQTLFFNKHQPTLCIEHHSLDQFSWILLNASDNLPI